MREHLVRTAGPAVVIVVECEGPIRAYASPEDLQRVELDANTSGDESRRRLLRLALDLAERDETRALAWSVTLRDEPGGIRSAAERLLEALIAAERPAAPGIYVDAAPRPSGRVSRLLRRLAR